MKNLGSAIVNSLTEDDYEENNKPPTEEPASNVEWVRADNVKSEQQQNEILKEILLELKSQNSRIRAIKDNVQFFFWMFFLSFVIPAIAFLLIYNGVFNH